MSAPRRHVTWLLALALLTSQWLLASHDARHWQPQDSKAHQCQLCFHHAAQDLISAGASAPVPMVAIDAAPLLPSAAVRVARPLRTYRSRAPPAVLA